MPRKTGKRRVLKSTKNVGVVRNSGAKYKAVEEQVGVQVDSSRSLEVAGRGVPCELAIQLLARPAVGQYRLEHLLLLGQ